MRRLAFIFIALLAATTAHASEWAGSSLSLRSSVNGIYCSAGAVRLSIDGEQVNGSAGNGVSLVGSISKDGVISLGGGQGAKRISFTGRKTGDRIRGAWVEALTGCGGTWRAEMIVADTIEPVQPPPGSDDASIFMEQPDEVPVDGAAPSEPDDDYVPIPPKTEQN